MRWERPTSQSNPGVFIDLARKAIALQPDNARSWESLAQSLLWTGRDEEAIATLNEAVARIPAEPRLHFMLADAYYRSGRTDLVDRAMRQAPAIPGDDRDATLFRLEILMKTGIADDVGRIAWDALALDPGNKEALEVLGAAARRDGTPEIMVPVCKAALERERGHARARYELATAYALLGRAEEARQLIDLCRFVTVTEVAVPAGYAPAGAFEAALAGEIAGNSTLKPDPAGKATKGGLQTSRNLVHTPGRATGVLLDLIRGAVDAFASTLSVESRDPFVETRPEEAWLDAWAIVFPGDGHQVTHIHPSGWLSGVYYVSAPKASGDDPRGGCLVLGSSDTTEAGIDPPWGLREIRPVPGKLVMFPSHVPHSTVSTKSPEARISIAFDVIPVRTGAAEGQASP
ncbi:MAG: putative 2OG-Fe(II) oxygenase [Reyranella sp.]|nr:putative 2OG-Fe(II) oxygenase [Reyranella sp.]